MKKQISMFRLASGYAGLGDRNNNPESVVSAPALRDDPVAVCGTAEQIVEVPGAAPQNPVRTNQSSRRIRNAL